MRKQLVNVLGIIAFLITPLAPVFADEAAPVAVQESVSTETETVAAPTVEETPTVSEEASVSDVVPEETPASSTEAVVTETSVATSSEVVTEEATSTSTFAALSTTASTTYVTIDGSVIVPNGCNATDAGGALHIYPEATSTPYLAICALEQAKVDGLISGYTLTDSSFGVYLTSVNGTDAGSTEYWALYLNDAYASCGVGCLPVSAGDKLSLVRTDFMTNAELDRIDLHVTSLANTYKNIIVPNHCTAMASDGTVLAFPADGSDDQYLAICGLVSAQSAGDISGFELTNSSFGPYLTSLNGTPAGSTEYWALYLNTDYASCGVGCLPLAKGDVLSIARTDFMTNAELERENFHVLGFTTVATTTATTTNNTGGGGGNGGGSGKTFNVSSAFSFLSSLQLSNGSWNSDLVTDWSAFAYAVPGAPSSGKNSLTSYLKSNAAQLHSVRDAERHALALMALNINPYTGTPVDYISPIVNSFDGSQLDDPSLVNDDIFGLIALLHAGYHSNDSMIQKIASFIISQQQSNGSWEGSVDITSAAIQALSQVRSVSGAKEAITSGKAYLKAQQQSDGGFADRGTQNPFSTAWALQAIAAAGETPSSWSTNGNTPLDSLVDDQQSDGGMSTNPGDSMTRAWATAYAIPAAKGLTWDDLLNSFSKPSAGVIGGGSGSHASSTSTTATTTTATSTPSIVVTNATTTVATVLPEVATTTAPVKPVVPVIKLAPPSVVTAPAETGSTSATSTVQDSNLAAGAAGSHVLGSVWLGISGFFKAIFGFFGRIF